MFTNPDFENDPVGNAPSGWSISSNLNPAFTDTRPNMESLADLNLAAGGVLITSVVGGALESQTDPDLGTNGTFRYPKYGVRAALVNYGDATTNGKNRNVNTLAQTMTISAADIDPLDHLVHVRFAVAPILEDPAHNYNQQPYYFVRLQNVTTNTTLYQDFSIANTAGIPWKQFTDASGNSAAYVDWGLHDIAPNSAKLTIGDQVELRVIAAGCSRGGHWGRIYVDSFGENIPGLYAWGTGPQVVNAGSNITYRLSYRNGGTTTTSGTKIDFVTPPNTTFVSTTGTGCTTPAVGATGTMTCPLGTLAPQADGSFAVTVNVASATATGTTIINGNYAISATGVSPLLGAKVVTNVTSGVAYSDVQVDVTDNRASIPWGQPTSYTITVRNAGPAAASSVSVSDTMPAQLTGVTWTCAATGGATCTAAGSGNISDTIALPVGALATYTVNATVIAGTGTGSVRNAVSVAVATQTDPDSNSNSAADLTSIGDPAVLSVSKTTAASLGTIRSEPAGITCGSGCTAQSGTFTVGSQVSVFASPATGATFVSWGGACSGSATSCTLTMSGALSVSATFAGAPASGTPSGNAQTTNVNTAFGQPLSVTVVDSAGTPVPGVQITFAAPGTGASAVLSATTATTNSSGVAQITATANATPGAYSVTATIPGVATPVAFALDNLGPPSSITRVSGSPQSATVQAGFTDPLVVEVRDAANQLLPNIAVTYTAPGPGASATPSPTTVLTGPTGQASLAVAANTIAGTYTVNATVDGVATPAAFTLTNTAGTGVTVSVVSGDGQSAVVNTAFGAALVAQLSDAFGNPVAGKQLTFTAPPNGVTATLTAPLATDVNGQTRVDATAKSAAGTFTVTAAFAGAASATFSETITAGAPATLTIASGDSQTPTVNTQFGQFLVVTVRDAFANPVSGATVAWSAPGGGASASVPPTATTNASGQASIRPTAGTVAGGYQITATVAGAPAVNFTATNLAGAAAAVVAASGTPQSAQIGSAFAPVVAKVTDAFGNAVAGTTVTFTVPGSGASATLSVASGVSDAQGRVSTTPTANTVTGTYNVTATAAAGSAQFALTNTAGPAASITVISGSPQGAVVNTQFGAALVVEVRDASGNLVPGASVAFTAPGTGATATPSAPTATTGSNGRAQVNATAGTIAGTYAMTATVNGQSTTFALTNTAGPAATVSAQSGSPQQAAVTTAFAPLVAKVVDAFGNPVAGATVTFASPGGAVSATLSPTSATTAADGTAQVGATARTQTGSYNVTASASGATPAAFALTNTPGPAAALTVIAGGTQATRAGTAFPTQLVVELRDAQGNLIPDAAITFSGPATGASASAPDATTGSNGRATVTATAGNVAGSYTFTAHAGSVTASFAFTNEAGPPSKVVITDGDNQSAPVLGPFLRELEVKVTDDLGNPIGNVSVSLRAPDPSGPTAQLSDVVVTTGADGLAGVAATAGRHAGAIDVVASIAGASATFHLSAVAGPPARVRPIAGSSPQATTVRTAYAAPLEVLVEDANGNPVSGATVLFNTPAGGATSDVTASVTTGADGHARTTATANGSAGSYFATATVTGVDPAVFGLTNLAGKPVRLIAFAGSGQQATVDTDFSALDVLVVDGDDNPVASATVAFTAPLGGATGTLAASSVATGPDGHATVAVHASTRSGAYVVTAVANDSAAPARFLLENLPGAAVAVTLNPTSSPQSTTVATRFTAPLIAVVVDAFGNPVPGAPVAFAVPASGASGTLSAPTATTDAQGRATVTITANAAVGEFSVTATTAGVPAAAFEMNNLAGRPVLLTLSDGALQATEVNSGFAQMLAVRVRDGNGNPLVGVAVTFTPAGSGASAQLAPSTAFTDANGEAVALATANAVAGSYVVTATTPQGEAPVAFDLTNRPGPVASIEALALTSPQVTQVGHGFLSPIGVLLHDGFGNLVSGEHVTFHVPGQEPTAELAVAEATSGPDGIASTLVIAGHLPGTYLATMAISDLTPVPVSLTNTVGPPSALVAVSGGGQHAMATTAFGAPVVLRVVDQYGNPVSGVTVTLTTPASGASGTLSVTQATSAADGTLAVTLDANAAPGTFAVTGSAPGTMPVAVMLTVDPIPTTTTIAVPDKTPIDKPITATITVTATLLVPQGQVELVDDTGAVLGHATLDTSGVAQIEGTLPKRGHHLVGARYTAQGSFGASSSATADIEATHDSGRLTGAGTDGCNAGGGAGLGVALMMALLFVRRRRALWLAAPVVLAVLASTAHAQSAGTRAIARLHPAAADSDWFAVDSVSFTGHREVSLAVTGDYAYRPLVIYNADDSRRVDIVRDSLILHFGASVTLFDRLRLSAVAPLYPYQDGDAANYNGNMLPGPSYAFGDLTLAGDVRVYGAPGDRVRAAVGVRVGLPTGSKTNYTSDDLVSGDLHGSLAGTSGRFEYGVGAQLLLREVTALADEDFGSELRGAAAIGMRFASGKLLIGPEAMAVLPVSGDSGAGHPLEVGVGLHYRVSRALLLGVGAGVGLVHAIGTPEERALASLAWNIQ